VQHKLHIETGLTRPKQQKEKIMALVSRTAGLAVAFGMQFVAIALILGA
jgi:hypothetical protein